MTKVCWAILGLIPNFSFAYDIKVDGIYYNANLEKMTISVTSGDSPYAGDIIIPSTITYNNRTLSVVSLLSNSFQVCPELLSVTINESVETIESLAFQGSKRLVKVTLPTTLKTIGTHVFWNCSSLDSIDIPEGITQIPQTCFYGCSNLKSVTIPQSVTVIDINAFQGCVSLIELKLPHSLKQIASKAFAGSGLTSISIPPSTYFIRCDAFNYELNGMPTSQPKKGIGIVRYSNRKTKKVLIK